MDIAVRPLTEADLDWAAAVLAATGLSARQPELRRYLALEPAGYYAAEVGGHPMGLGGYVGYDRFAFVGNMAVAQEFQGRGAGRAILTRLLEEIDRRGIPETVLEATPEGERLYRKCGFVEAYWTRAYSRVEEKVGQGRSGPAVERLSGSDLDAAAAFDAPRFGTPRRRVLERFLGDFPGRGFVVRRAGGDVSGYLIAQSRVLGPWVAENAEAAESLLTAALALPFDGPAVAYAPAPNGAAAALLARLGFAAHWESLRMRRGGTGPLGRPECVFGLAALAIG
jgi:GNAT superfamily N-acetyltransferase